MNEKFYRLIFKILRIIRKNWCLVKLDFDGADLFIIAENWREYGVRAQSCQKEPETTAWLKTSCRSGEILYDIGANIGAYTLVGASLGARVLAFEPSYSNFGRLNENVSMNNLDPNVQSFPVAFSKTKKIGQFQFLDSTPGSSACFYNESGQFHSKIKNVESSKAVLVYNLDSFIAEFELPPPTLLKIDVDGAEMEILEGARNTLLNKALRKAIIEVDHRIVEKDSFLKFMESFQFKVTGQYPRGVEGVFNYTFERT